MCVLAGWSCEMDEILEFAKHTNIKVIEDCAQSLGAEYKGKKLEHLEISQLFLFVRTKY